jgi:predicted phage tail protein
MKTEKFIKVGILYNAFDPSKVEHSEILYRKNTTLARYLHDLPKDCEWKIGLNGTPVTLEEHGKTRLKPTDTIQLVVVPRGGGAKNILRMVAMVALVVGAFFLFAPAAIGGLALLGGSALAVGIGMSVFTLAGGLLINALLAPKTPKIDNEESSSYGYDGAKNTAKEGVAIPVVYGEYRVAGNYVDLYTENVGDDQYLYGRTVLSDGLIDGVSAPYLNDQPITSYDAVTWGFTAGSATETVNPLFSRSISQVTKNAELTYANGYMTHTTTEEIDRFQVNLAFPKGIVHFTTKKGNKDWHESVVTVEYKLASASTWTQLNGGNTDPRWPSWAFNFTDKRAKVIRKTIESQTLTPGIYNIRVRKITQNLDEDHDMDQTIVTDIGEIVTGGTTLRHVANAYYKIKMNEQLSNVPNITWLVKGVKVNHYDINGNVTQKAWTDNPAWIVLDMLIGEERGTPGIYSIDFPAFVEWAQWCEDNSLKFNGVFDTTTTLWDACVDVLKIGHAAFSRVGTKLSLAIDKPQQPVMLFGPGNIFKDTFSISYIAMADRANEFEISYYDKEDLNTQKTIRVVDPEADQRGDVPRAVSYSVPGIDNFDQALQEVWYQLYNNRYLRRTVSFEAPVESIGLGIGDVALIQHDVVNWGVSGRLGAGSNELVIKLDRPVTMEDNKDYSILVIGNAASRGTYQVVGSSGNVVTLAGTNGKVLTLENCKRLVQGEVDRSIEAINVVGNSAYVTVGGDNDFVTGTNATVWDTDVIEERDVVYVEGTTDTITVATAFGAAPAQYSNFMFGDKEIVKKPYRLKALTGTGFDQRKLTFVEYNEAIYNPPETIVPYPATTEPKTVLHVRSLAFAHDQYGSYDNTSVDGVLSWQTGHIKNYGGADIYMSIGDAEFTFYQTIFNTNECQIKVSTDQEVAVKVISFNTDLTRASSGAAPTLSLEVDSKASVLDAPTALSVAQISYLATALVEVIWNGPDGLTTDEQTRIRYRVQVKPEGNTEWDEYGVTDQYYLRVGDLRVGTHEFRVRSEIGNSFSDWRTVNFTTFTTTETIQPGATNGSSPSEQALLEQLERDAEAAKDSIEELIETYGTTASAAQSAAEAEGFKVAAENAKTATEGLKSDAEIAAAAAEVSRQASEQAETDANLLKQAAEAAKTASEQARDNASGSANAANGSAQIASTKADEAGISATAAQASAVVASTAARALLPSTFTNADSWSSNWVGATGKITDDARFTLVNDTTFGNVLNVNNVPAFAPHIVPKGDIELVPDRIFEISVQWMLRSGQNGDNPVNGILWAVGIKPDGNANGTYNIPINITVGGVGWGTGYGFKLDKFDVPSNALLADGYTKIRPLIRIDNQGVFSLRTLSIRDVTAERAAKGFADASAESASTASIKATESGNSASSANTSRVNAETAAGNANAYQQQASQSAQDASGSAQTAGNQAGAAATSAYNAGQSANAASNSAQTASTKADEAGNSANAANSSKVAAESAFASAKGILVNSGPTSFRDLYSWTQDFSGGAGDLSGDARFSVRTTNGVTGLGVDNRPHFSPHIASKSLFTLSPGRRLRVNLKWLIVDASSGNPQVSLYLIGRRSNGTDWGISTAFTIQSGQNGWGEGSVYAHHSFECSADDFIAQGVYAARTLARIDVGGYYKLDSMFVEDITDVYNSWNNANASASSAQTASTKADEASQSANAASQSKTDAQTAMGQAQTFAGNASTSANNAAGHEGNAYTYSQNASQSANNANNSANAAAGSAQTASTKANEASVSANAAETSKVSASNIVRANYPSVFNDLNDWSWDWGTASGSLSSDSRFILDESSDGLGRKLGVSNVPHFTPHIVSKGYYPIVRDRRYKITSKLRLRGGQTGSSVSFALFFIGIKDGSFQSGDYWNNASQSFTVGEGQEGWGNGLNTSYIEVNSNTLWDNGVRWIRPLLRIDSQGYYWVTSLQLEDITSANTAKNYADAAAQSASTASIKADEAGNSASAANTSRTNAETAANNANTYRGQAETFRNEASVSASNASGSANTASQQAGLASGSAYNASQYANAASNSANTATTKANEASNSASAVNVSKIEASSYASGNLIGKANFTDGQKGNWSGAVTVQWDGGINAYVLQQTARDVLEGELKDGNWASRRFRMTGNAAAWNGVPARIGFQTKDVNGNINYPTILARPAGTGYGDFSGEFVLGNDVVQARPFLQSANDNGETTHGINWRWFRIEDITSEKNAESFANAASGWSNSASSEANRASGRADAANGYANSAESYRNDAYTHSQNASTYASQADGYRSAAQSASNLAATYSAGGGNMIGNSEFLSKDGWSAYANGAGFDQWEINYPLGDAWHPEGKNVLTIHQNNGDTGLYGQWFYGFMPVVGGQFYEFTAKVAAHRANAEVRIDWYDVDGNGISSTYSGQMATSSGGRQIGNYSHMVARGYAPANAAKALVVVLKMGTFSGQGDSWLWFCEPMFRKYYEAGQSPSTYAAGNGLDTTKTLTANVAQNAIAIADANTQLGSLRTTVQAGNPNLLKNGGFERGITGWVNGYGSWTAISNTWGPYAYIWVGATMTQDRYYYMDSAHMEVDPNTQYTYSCTYGVSGNNGNIRGYTEILWLNSSGQEVSRNGATSRNASFWFEQNRREVATVTSPSNAVKALVRVILYAPNGATVDQMAVRQQKFERGSVATPYSSEATVNTINEAIVTTDGKATTALARAAVKVDVNGLITGWETNNNGQTGNFKVFADNFSVEPSSSSGNRMAWSDGTLRIYAGDTMYVVGKGFGSSNQFLEWTGPAQTNLANCTEANAIKFVKTNGQAYYAGGIIAGTLKNSNAWSGLAATGSTTAGPFGSNGNDIAVNASYSMSCNGLLSFPATSTGLNNYNSAISNLQSNGYNISGSNQDGHYGGKSDNRTTDFTLSLVKGSTTVSTLNTCNGSITLEGQAPVPGDSQAGWIKRTYNYWASFTWNDTEKSTANRTFTVNMSRFNPPDTIASQRVSITTTEW